MTVNTVSSLQSATKESLVFVEDAAYFKKALQSGAAAIIVGEFAAANFGASAGTTLLICEQPRLAFARAAKMLREGGRGGGIHPTAVVSASSTLGSDVAIGAQAILGENVCVGERTTIGPGAILGDNVRVGMDCRIDPNVTIYEGTVLGDRVMVQAGAVLGSEGFGYVRDAKTGRYEQSPQIGQLVVEDEVEIGANATIDRGALDETRIRRGSKIDNLVHVGHNVQIGQNVVIAAQTGISGSVAIEDDVIIGGQVGIGDHARVGAGAILGSQCGILTNKILRGKGVVFWGTPARPLREYLKEMAYLSRSAKRTKDADGKNGEQI